MRIIVGRSVQLSIGKIDGAHTLAVARAHTVERGASSAPARHRSRVCRRNATLHPRANHQNFLAPTKHRWHIESQTGSALICTPCEPFFEFFVPCVQIIRRTKTPAPPLTHHKPSSIEILSLIFCFFFLLTRARKSNAARPSFLTRRRTDNTATAFYIRFWLHSMYSNPNRVNENGLISFWLVYWISHLSQIDGNDVSWNYKRRMYYNCACLYAT